MCAAVRLHFFHTVYYTDLVKIGVFFSFGFALICFYLAVRNFIYNCKTT